MFGLNGNDVMDGGPGHDIILGGPDGGPAPGGPPNSDIMFGGPGNDVNLWAPGDGSEAFIGGPGRDALIFGATDREALPDPTTGVRLPTLLFGVPGFPQGIPDSGREWSDKFLHGGGQPLAGVPTSSAFPRRDGKPHRHGPGERYTHPNDMLKLSALETGAHLVTKWSQRPPVAAVAAREDEEMRELLKEVGGRREARTRGLRVANEPGEVGQLPESKGAIVERSICVTTRQAA